MEPGNSILCVYRIHLGVDSREQNTDRVLAQQRERGLQRGEESQRLAGHGPPEPQSRAPVGLLLHYDPALPVGLRGPYGRSSPNLFNAFPPCIPREKGPIDPEGSLQITGPLRGNWKLSHLSQIPLPT